VTRLRVAAAITIVLASCNLFERLHTKADSGAIDPKVDPPIASAPDAEPIEGGLAGLIGLLGGPEDEPEEVDAGCPVPIHPGYCRGRCKPFTERKAYPHAQRVYPSAGVAFGKCGSFDVFAERDPDGGGITEWFGPGGILVAAVDSRQKCGKYGAIPTCTPALSWDAGWAPVGLGGIKK
jgi:hypothetical protein